PSADYVSVQGGSSMTPVINNNAAATTGGSSVYRNASFTAVNAKSSAGTLYGLVLINTTSSTRYVQVYNVSGAPTNGSSTVIETYPLAAFDNKAFNFGDIGTAYGTGIGFGCTTDAAGTTSATAGDCIIGSARYK